MYTQILYFKKNIEGVTVPCCFLHSNLNKKYSDIFYSKEQVLVYILSNLHRNRIIEFSEVQDLCTRLRHNDEHKLPICIPTIGESNAHFLKRCCDIMDQIFEIINFTKKVYKKPPEELFYEKMFIEIPKTLEVPYHSLLSKT